MGEKVIPKEIQEYFQPSLPTVQPGIVNVPINVNNFEFKSMLTQMARDIVFRRLPTNEPQAYSVFHWDM